MKYDEVWSYPIDRIRNYFNSVYECTDSEGSESVFSDGVSFSLKLEALPDRQVGPISFPQTRVVIEGTDAEQVYHGFYLHFLSGGA